MKKDRYIYPALFHYATDGISVTFPDLPGCITCGDEPEEAFRMAREAMALHLYGMEQDNEDIPQPSAPTTLKAEQAEVVTLIEVWMPPFRDEMENRAVKKTLTIPKWLDDLAQENKVNFSHVLQDALKKHLGISNKNA
ncbi:type II toxin-antitoxin system HicB family antitoxin [Brevibacillus brevis]|uniref:type II toxin-antitoxin system HicB family antitoxin n=1 Tax=Brevibacillus brevis TaxID=1393 RepID=UPI001157F64B|nr:type II toxin-antitoxin system HicB family antitoxin [Lysinibacillus sp. SDF0063]TQR33956.1 type II toxin-antitoxin system HicB family antitoxin [Lysinibacillus sp. SDF0063]